MFLETLLNKISPLFLLKFPVFCISLSLIFKSIHLPISAKTAAMTLRLTSLFLSPFNKNKAQGMAAGLVWVWLCGIFLIGISFYATQRLPSTAKDQVNKPKFFWSNFLDPFDPTITIFTAPRPFSGLVGERQSLAVRSWLGLSPNLSVVLFSQDPSAFTFAAAFASRVLVEPNIDFSFVGTPFFHSMIARSQVSSSEISVLIHPELLLFPDFISTIKSAHKLDHDWFLFASSQEISAFPFQLDADGKHWLSEDGKKLTEDKLQEFLAPRLHQLLCGTDMLIAWNNGDLPLHNGVLPPFLYGKGLHSHWIVAEVMSSKYRFILDASWTISGIYLNDLGDVSDSEERSWEFAGNFHVGMLYGSFHFHEGNISKLFNFINCGGRYLLVNKVHNIVYQLGTQTPFSLGIKDFEKCINMRKPLEKAKTCLSKKQMQWEESVSLPLSLEFLLSLRADPNKTIVLAVAGYNYKDMLMSWVCRLQKLQISNFLVCAIDHDIYDFSVLQGLPVFQYANTSMNISFDNCHFGTECFQKVTKVKSRIVLDILKLGYNVLMSDVDIYWFRNPLPLLSSFGPAILVAQSDEHNTRGPINLPRRLNSGFYFARSDRQTIAALEKVVQHASTSNLSEQPSFYDTLCGEGGSNRIGDDRCVEPETNLTVHFLDRDLFPNGAYQNLWEGISVKDTCAEKGCFVLHNNWISGRRKKLERQILSGLWAYDMSLRMCIHSWQENKSMSYF